MKMNKLIAVCLITAAAGVVIAGAGVHLGGKVYGISFGKNGIVVNSNKGAGDDQEYIKESRELEAFDKLDMEIDFADIQIEESDHFGIEYCVNESRPISLKAEGKNLVITQAKQGGGNFIFFSLGGITLSDSAQNEYVTLYVPKGEKYQELSIANEFGDILLPDIQADKLTVKSSFGDIKTGMLEAVITDITMESGDFKAEGIKGDSLKLVNSFGKVSIENAGLTGPLTAKVESGDVELERIEAGSLDVSASFGKVSGDTISAEKMVFVLGSGDCIIGEVSGTDVTVQNNFGDIDLGLREGIEAYSTEAETEFGSIDVNKEDMGSKYKDKNSSSGRSLILNCESGDIKLYDTAR